MRWNRGSRLALAVAAVLVALPHVGCKPPRVLFVTAHMKMKAADQPCEVTKDDAWPAKLTAVRQGDLVVWAIRNKCDSAYKAIVKANPKDDPFDGACVRETFVIQKDDYSFVGCVVTGKKRQDPYKYDIVAAPKRTGQAVDDYRGELEIQIYP